MKKENRLPLPSNPATGTGAVLPDHGPRDLKWGTLRAAITQLGIDWNAFIA